ncbi:MAG: hypothetical protein H0V43_12215 [Gemmatimonadales bacterium]|nr:hypothetical protein [Gemmatimonadales bacterium]
MTVRAIFLCLTLASVAPVDAESQAADSVRGTLRYKVRGLSAVQGGLLSGAIMSVATGVGLQAAVTNILRLVGGAAKLSGDPSVGQFETYLRTGKGFDFSGAPISAGQDIVLDFLLEGDGKGVYRLKSGSASYSGNTDASFEHQNADGFVQFTDVYRGERSVQLTPENASITLTTTGKGENRRAQFDVSVGFPVAVVGKSTWTTNVMEIFFQDNGEVLTSGLKFLGQNYSDKTSSSPMNAIVSYSRSGPLDSILRGSETWQDLRDSGVLVQWNLSGVNPDDLELAIDGPACACLEAEKVPGARVTWTARPSKTGGTFAPFTIQAAGVAPKVVENGNGRVVLEPARGTGAVTLVANYTRQGKEATASRSVNFCVIDSIRVADGERDFAFDDAAAGLLGVPKARSKATYNGGDVSAELAWTFERIGPPGETTMAPAAPRGDNVTVHYTGLPTLNGAFGKKRIDVKIQTGPCNCSRTTSFRAFYSPRATNHPPAGADALGEQPVPNWFYYMAQSGAMRGIDRVAYARQRTATGGGPAIGQFDEETGMVFLTGRLWQVGCTPAVRHGGKPVAIASARGGNSGIDCVAETARHEDQHRRDDATWWLGDYSITEDVDLDRVPRSVERQRPGCRDTSARSCDERPFNEVGDREINAYWTGWAWPRGSADAEDWSCGPNGKQWNDGINCAD